MVLLRVICLCVLLCSLVIADGQGSYLHDPKNVHNVEHMKQHLGEDVELSDQEANEFHYFKLHDYDNNNKLDGHELGLAMTHFHEGDDEDGGTPSSYAMDDDQMANLIEIILKEDDLNNDGYVDYYEFIQASRSRKEEEDDKNNL